MSEQKPPEKSSVNEKNRTLQDTQDHKPKEYGGPKGMDPTRYGDWEKNGRCIDF